MYWLILLLIGIPAIEVAIFLWAGDAIGIWSVLLIIVLTGMIGVVLVKKEGLKTWQRLQLAIQTGNHPSEEILDGLCIIVAGIFLVTPGLFTDVIGFLLVIPFTRKPFKWLIMMILMRKLRNGQYIYRKW